MRIPSPRTLLPPRTPRFIEGTEGFFTTEDTENTEGTEGFFTTEDTENTENTEGCSTQRYRSSAKLVMRKCGRKWAGLWASQGSPLHVFHAFVALFDFEGLSQKFVGCAEGAK